MIFLLLACAETVTPPAPPPPQTTETAPGESLYDVSMPLIGPDGKGLGMDVYRGHPTLVSMIYTHCSQACPMLISRLQAVEAKLKPEELANLRVLLISMDPERDPPAELRATLEGHHLDPERWTIAQPRTEDVRMIAALLGIRYRQLPDGTFSHSSQISLLDETGVPVARMEGLASDDAALIEAIRR